MSDRADGPDQRSHQMEYFARALVSAASGAGGITGITPGLLLAKALGMDAAKYAAAAPREMLGRYIDGLIYLVRRAIEVELMRMTGDQDGALDAAAEAEDFVKREFAEIIKGREGHV